MHDPPDYESYCCAARILPGLLHERILFGDIVNEFEMPASQMRASAMRPCISPTDLIRGSMRYHASLWKPQKKKFGFTKKEIKRISKRWPNTARKFKDPFVNFDEVYQHAADAVLKMSSAACSSYLRTTKGVPLAKNADSVKMLVYQRLLLLSLTTREELEKMTPKIDGNASKGKHLDRFVNRKLGLSRPHMYCGSHVLERILKDDPQTIIDVFLRFASRLLLLSFRTSKASS